MTGNIPVEFATFKFPICSLPSISLPISFNVCITLDKTKTLLNKRYFSRIER